MTVALMPANDRLLAATAAWLTPLLRRKRKVPPPRRDISAGLLSLGKRR